MTAATDTLLMTTLFHTLSSGGDSNTRAFNEWKVGEVTTKYRGPKTRISSSVSLEKKLSETQKVLKYIERDFVSQLTKTNSKICGLLGNKLPRR